jgi:hypothetical protein
MVGRRLTPATALALFVTLALGPAAQAACYGWWGDGEDGGARFGDTTNNLGLRATVTLFAASPSAGGHVARVLQMLPQNGRKLVWGFYKGAGYPGACAAQTSGWRLFCAGLNQGTGQFFCYSNPSWPTYSIGDTPMGIRMEQDPWGSHDGESCNYDWFLYADGIEREWCRPLDDNGVKWRYSASTIGFEAVDVDFADMKRRVYSTLIDDWIWSSISAGDSCHDPGYHVRIEKD